MRILLYTYFLFALYGSVCQAQVNPYHPDPSPANEIPGYVLKWSDEFNGIGAPDKKNWKHEAGFVRNEEDQWYQPQNASCSNGALHITAKREQFKNPNYNISGNNWRSTREFVNYTSSSIKTEGLHSWLYGCFVVRAKIPAVQGSWPAIWTLGITQEWPSCGEIDIMEYYRNSILANAAWGTDRRYIAKWNSTRTPFTHFTEKDPDWADKYHVWRMDWTPEFIKLYLDDELLNSIDLMSTINSNGSNPFHQPHYLLLNLAIGGANGGNPAQTAFPLIYSIDYARVYQVIEK